MTPHDVAAEYLALTLARRRPDLGAERIAQLTGLDVMTASRLTRMRDLTEITRRRDALNIYTRGTAWPDSHSPPGTTPTGWPTRTPGRSPASPA